METIKVVKIGGHVIDDEAALHEFLVSFCAIPGPKILVHGGGKLTDRLASLLGVEQKVIEGRRMTDAPTLDIAVMVYAGLINKRIVALLQKLGCQAAGFSGADGGLLCASRRVAEPVDYGYVGDVKPGAVNTKFLNAQLQSGVTPVICAITHNGEGQLLNTNADSIASVIAIALRPHFKVDLFYCFEKPGVMLNPDNENSCIRELSETDYRRLKSEGVLYGGMLPKLDNAFRALASGSQEVCICGAASLQSALSGRAGTKLKVE
ncbi:MAG: acetylglutamate kinase [Bacteroidetes bacterium]|nr:acetylglutamate kinase [Bacteroidota bacterium]